MIESAGTDRQRRIWPWALLALLLLTGIALFFVYMPRNPGQQPSVTSLADPWPGPAGRTGPSAVRDVS